MAPTMERSTNERCNRTPMSIVSPIVPSRKLASAARVASSKWTDRPRPDRLARNIARSASVSS
jgi:hypothetical protein